MRNRSQSVHKRLRAVKVNLYNQHERLRAIEPNLYNQNETFRAITVNLYRHERFRAIEPNPKNQNEIFRATAVNLFCIKMRYFEQSQPICTDVVNLYEQTCEFLSVRRVPLRPRKGGLRLDDCDCCVRPIWSMRKRYERCEKPKDADMILESVSNRCTRGLGRSTIYLDTRDLEQITRKTTYLVRTTNLCDFIYCDTFG